MNKRLSLLAALALAAALPSLSAQAAPAGPKAATCPAPVPEGARCYTGADGTGALYWIAIPKDWNLSLIHI